MAEERILFVSDWHLLPERDDRTQAFLRFLETACRGAGHVFVLGDLFDAWVGPRHAALPGHAFALDALGQLAASGTRVTLARGNRDFLLDRRTARRYGLELAPNVWRGTLGGLRVRLSHGDELTEDDLLHKAARAITSHFPVSTVVRAMPLCASGVLARAYRGLSSARRARRKRRKLRPAEPRLRAELDAGTGLIVIGHWHEPALHPDALGLAGKTLVMLGECTEREAVYAELVDGAVTLRHVPQDA